MVVALLWIPGALFGLWVASMVVAPVVDTVVPIVVTAVIDALLGQRSLRNQRTPPARRGSRPMRGVARA